MSAPVMTQMIVILTLCVLTLKDLMFVNVLVDTRVTVETAQVNALLKTFPFFTTAQYFKARSRCCFYLSAVITGCSPSCGPNAVCQEIGEVPACVCNPGFQGDGYNCTGKILFVFVCVLTSASERPNSDVAFYNRECHEINSES